MMDTVLVEQQVEQLFDDLEEFLGGSQRWRLPYGFSVDSVRTWNEPNPFAPALLENRTDVTLRMPVVWELVRGAPWALASDTPSTDEVDQLRGLLENRLRSGRYLRSGRLKEWTASIPDGPRPSSLD